MLGAACVSMGTRSPYLAGDPLRLDRPRRLGELADPAESLFALPTRGWMTVRGIGPGRLARWLEQYSPDVVHVANPAHIGIGIMAACRQLGIPLVVTTMDFWWVCPKSTLLRPDGSVCEGTRDWSECIRCLAGSRPERWMRGLAGLPECAAGLALGAFYAKAAARDDSIRFAALDAAERDIIGRIDRGRSGRSSRPGPPRR